MIGVVALLVAALLVSCNSSKGDTQWEENDCGVSYEEEIEAKIAQAWAMYTGNRSRVPPMTIEYGNWIQDGSNDYYRRDFTAQMERPGGFDTTTLYEVSGQVYSICAVLLDPIEVAGSVLN